MRAKSVRRGGMRQQEVNDDKSARRCYALSKNAKMLRVRGERTTRYAVGAGAVMSSVW